MEAGCIPASWLHKKISANCGDFCPYQYFEISHLLLFGQRGQFGFLGQHLAM
jgi:hypothetical protein